MFVLVRFERGTDTPAQEIRRVSGEDCGKNYFCESDLCVSPGLADSGSL
jgi:hypothetical protein